MRSHTSRVTRLTSKALASEDRDSRSPFHGSRPLHFSRAYSTVAGLALTCLVLLTVLSLLFCRSYLPGLIHFSNDGPLGRMASACHRLPERFFGSWGDLNLLGSPEGGAPPNLSFGLQYLLKPVLFSKFYPLISLMVLGLGAWCFFNQTGLHPLACLLGGLAAALNSNYFSVACWGIAAHTIAIGMTFFALAALVRPTWPRVMLAGLAVGLAVSEGADTGAILSLYVAAFALYQACIAPGPRARNLVGGAARLGLVALCAFWIAAQAVVGLVATNIEGITGTKQDAKTRAEHWDWATQWSLPKREALGFLMPGLFGYRMDTPNGGNYWGATGRDPAWDRYFDNGQQGPQPSGFKRHSGGGFYAGMLVVLIAVWAAILSGRAKGCPFTLLQRRWLWFWSGVTLLSLLLSFGRFAPFYRIVYALPYFSTIRNPVKFLYLVSFGLLVLFAYGLDLLCRKYMPAARFVVPASAGRGGARNKAFDSTRSVAEGTYSPSRVRDGTTNQPEATPTWSGLKAWWSNAGAFDKGWVYGCIAALTVSLLGWLIYDSFSPALERYLESVQFDPAVAPNIAAFSIRQVGWFVLFLAMAAALMVLVLSGAFSGSRARWGAILLGALLVVDLGRANRPWVIYWDYKGKYASNPILDLLRDKPYEHRVAGLPFRPLPRLGLLDQLYHLEWLQHQIPYYDIQSLDIVQMPRLPEDLAAFESAMLPASQTDLTRLARRWQLTNTRYLLGPASFLNSLNQQVDPAQHRFHIVERFNLTLKPAVSGPAKLSDMTAVLADEGSYALFEFTGALPRARLYFSWRICTNNSEALDMLTGPSFDPETKVLVAENVPVSSPDASHPLANSPSPGPSPLPSDRPLASDGRESQGEGNREGTGVGGEGKPTASTEGNVHFVSYSPKDIVLKSDAPAASMLLLNDRFNPNWKATVDGRPQTLLRCNFLMRGLYLQAGAHNIELRYRPPVGPLYVSLAAIGFGIPLLGFVVLDGRRISPRRPTLVTRPSSPVTGRRSPAIPHPSPVIKAN